MLLFVAKNYHNNGFSRKTPIVSLKTWRIRRKSDHNKDPRTPVAIETDVCAK
jgi:hypothetical protein